MKQLSAASSAIGNFRKLSALTQAAVLAVASLLPILALASPASADQLTSRSVTITDSVVSETGVEYDFDFTIPTNVTVQGAILEFCTAPLGTCTLPTGMDVNRSLADLTSVGGALSGFTEFTTDNTGDCDDTAGASTDTMFCIANASGGAVGPGAAAIDLEGITNPSSIQTVYIRIALYSDDDFQSADLVHAGTVAAAIVDQLQISGRVQERLDFCVAAIDDTDSAPADVATCSALSDQNVDIGVIDESSVAMSPVDTTATNGADDDYGILMVNTNAGGGVALSYYAEDTSAVSGGDTDQLKSFRVVPTNCDANAALVTDQCFVSAANGGTGTTISAGTELFGMYIPCVEQTGITANITTVDADYNGSDDAVSEVADCETEANTVVAWNTSGTADALASSTAVVDDEVVKLRFAATASPTTPSGNYTVVTTYIATATF